MLKKFLIFIVLTPAILHGADETFDDFEIRVIRPRYFVKRQRFEIGAQFSAITNQTFVYTYLLGANIGYHFTEQVGAEFMGAYGFSMEKTEQQLLDKDFDINTQIATTERYYGASIQWTSMYGKYQLRSGRLVYFDTFLSGGGGMIGIRQRYNHCGDASTRSASVFDYPYFEVGLGQRFFVSKADSLRWDLKGQMFAVNSADAACVEGVEGENFFSPNISLHLGYGRFL